ADVAQEVALGAEPLDDPLGLGSEYVAVGTGPAVHRVAAAAEAAGLRLLAALAAGGDLGPVAVVAAEAVLRVLGHDDVAAVDLHVHLPATAAQPAHDLLCILEFVGHAPHRVAVALALAADDEHVFVRRGDAVDDP